MSAKRVSTERIDPNLPHDYAAVSGDSNLIHIDPHFARRMGLKTNILHGMCTVGLCVKHMIGAGDPGEMKTVKIRFVHPVFPEDVLGIESQDDSQGTTFKVTNQAGQVVLEGAARGR